MARKRERAFAMFGALLFLITSSALTIAVIYTIIQQNKKPSDGAASSAAKNSSTAANTTTPTTTNTTSPLAGYPQLTSTTSVAGDKLESFTPTSKAQTKLAYQDIKVGTGATVKAGDTITADYVGALMKTGVIFDASADHGGPQTFSLSGVIPGWSQAIPGMKIGGTRRLLIPASLAYGSQAQSGIPANSDLVFDVTVTAIGN